MSTGSHKRQRPRIKLHYSFKKIMTGSDLSRRRLPLMSATSTHPGPVVWLTACSHGDEVSGIVVIQEVFKRIRRRLLQGAIRAFPLMNPLGFEAGSRHITMSQEDLNRSFPGKPNGSLGERIAHSIFGTILATKPTLVLDLHNDWIESIPYALLDHDPGIEHEDAYRRAVRAGSETGMCLIGEAEQMRGSLSFNLLLRGVPALTIELGKSYAVSEANVTHGVEAIWNVLAHLGMVEPREEPFRYPLPPGYDRGKVLRYLDRPYGSRTGIIRFLARPGQIVRAGEPLARIVNAFGRHLETMTALQDAIVLGHSDSPVAFPGVPVMAFGVGEGNDPEADSC